MPGENKRCGRPPKVNAEMLAKVASTLSEVTVSELKRVARIHYGHEGSATLVAEVARAEKIRRNTLGSTAVTLLRASISNADVRTSFLPRIESYPETSSGRIPEPLSEAAARIGENVRCEILRAIDIAHREFVDRLVSERDRHRKEVETARQLIVDLRDELNSVRAIHTSAKVAASAPSPAQQSSAREKNILCRCNTQHATFLSGKSVGEVHRSSGERFRDPRKTKKRDVHRRGKRGARKSGRRRCR